MSLLFYKRPDYVAKNPGPMEASDYQKYLEKSRRSIPTELCFENVVSNRAMPVRSSERLLEPKFNCLPAMLPLRLHGLPGLCLT